MKRHFPLLLLLVALAVAWLPLLPPHAIAGHSALHDWARSEAVHAAVRGGDLLPAWLPDLYDRHGTPMPLFYAPFSYVVVELFRLATGSPGAAMKLSYLLFWSLGTIGAAIAARRLFGAGAGLPAAAAFALAPYLLADIYLRTGIAEFAGLSLVPWAIAAFGGPAPAAKAGVPPGGRTARAEMVGGAVVVGALVLTHNVTALLLVPILLVLAFLGSLRWRGVLAIFAGVAGTLFFWLPALVEKRHLWAEESLTSGFFDYTRHFVSAWNLLPFRTALEFTAGRNAGAPFRWGELLWLGLLAGAVVAWRLGPKERRLALFLAGVVALSLFMTASISAPLWKVLPLISFVQFPFRFFLLATAFAAPLVGLAVSRVPERWRWLAAAATVAVALWIARPYLSVRYQFLDRENSRPHSVRAAELEAALREPRFAEPPEWLAIERIRVADASGAAGHEYLPRTVTVLPDALKERTDIAARPLSGGVEVLAFRWGYPEVGATVAVSEPGELVLQQFWFPGWRVEVDGKERPIRAEPGRGRIVVALVPGDREVLARFGPTPLRRATRWASLGAILAAGWAISRYGGPPRRSSASSIARSPENCTSSGG